MRTRRETYHRTHRERRRSHCAAFSLCARVLILLATLTLGIGHAGAQDIAQIAKSDPLIITGAVGTQNTYHYNSTGMGYASPWSSIFYANLNVSIYGISMPFSLSYSNSNWDFNYPHFTLSLAPHYKNWTGYIGQSSMSMSPYVMNMGFNGIGVEFDNERLRAGIFYGVLRKAINDDPNDPLARSPQMKRVGWGFKVGYGTSHNFVDVYLLRAFDQPGSIDEHWRSRVTPQENIVVGLRGGVAPFRWLSLNANAAMSLFNTDRTAPKVENETADRFDGIFPTRYSSLPRFAGDVSANINVGGVNASLVYRLVQPDYTSLGTYYMSNNYHSLGVTLSTVLLRRVALSGTFSGQADNLTKRQMFTTQGYVYGAHASSRVGQHVSLSASYNGYLQRQSDGTVAVTDSTRVHRRMSSVTFTPSYNTENETLGHTVSLSTAYTSNKDLNRYSTGQTDVWSLALGAAYDINVKPWEISFQLSLNRQESHGYNTKYTSNIASLGASRSFLKEKNLNVSANVSLCYNEVRRQSKSLSIGGNINASYVLKQVHAFSAQASFNKFGDVNITKTRSNLDDTDISVGFSYAYTFSIVAIQSRAHRAEAKKKKAAKVDK